ncbi:MAG: sigma-70 family RNA polymerase sigma factor [Saprospiraceae bacterium]|nr:sigma-70 family RNA polymerase sigma factor [Saprospiraceae bacterium]
MLYRRYFPTMIQMCLRYTNGDRERALEILNDGFLRVFKKIDTFEFKGSLEGWIRRLVFHAISDYFKQNQKYLDSFVFSEIQPEAKTVGGTEGVLSNMYYDDLLKIIEYLPPATREVFRLYAIEGFNHSEIGEQLHISVGTSKWHLSVAREQLRKLLDKQTTSISLILFFLNLWL